MRLFADTCSPIDPGEHRHLKPSSDADGVQKDDEQLLLFAANGEHL
jgi:hypothetical protein